jgi:photosystem II stability/assembly factor-like uncharacterized protein
MSANNNGTHVYVGFAGEGENIGAGGLYRRAPGGEWESAANGLPANPQVRALQVNPENPKIVYAGTQLGPYRSDDWGQHWEALEPPTGGTDVWSLAFHPGDPNIMYAGYEPCAIYRSENGGEKWAKTDTNKVVFPHVTTYMQPLAKRVIGIAADPSDPQDVYAAVEVGGLLASRDSGASWEAITDGLYVRNNTVDLHGVQVSPAAKGTVFIVTQIAMFLSRDRGHSWEHVRVTEMFPGGSYCRSLLVAPDDPKTMYLAASTGGGGAPAGTVEKGALFRSRDLAQTWEEVDVGESPASRMFDICIDRAAPSNIIAVTHDARVYTSNDEGSTWNKSQVPVGTARDRHVYTIACG